MSRDPEEVGAILPLNPIHIDQFQIRLVDEGRGLQRMLNPLACHVSTGKPMQFAIDDGHQFFQRLLVALAPGQEQLCHFSHCSVWFSGAIIALTSLRRG